MTQHGDNAYLLETADRVTRAKASLDSAESAVLYYTRVLEGARSRVAEKQQALIAALADLKALGGDV